MSERETVRGALTEQDLSLPLEKPRLPWVRLAYRGRWLLRRLVGRDRTLRLCLNAAWLFHQFAHELHAESLSETGNGAEVPLDPAIVAWLPPQARVLDLGCNTGHWTRALARHATEVVGIDFSGELIEVARRLTSASNVAYRCGDVCRDLEGERFDVVFASHIISLVDDVDTLLAQLHQVAPLLIVGVADFEADHLNVVRFRRGCPYWCDAAIRQEYTADILRAQLARNGWTVQDDHSRAGTLWAVASTSASPPLPPAAAGARHGLSGTPGRSAESTS